MLLFYLTLVRSKFCYKLGFCHRHLELRTEGSHARVCELGSIRLFNVTSANEFHFLPNFVHNHSSIWNNGSEFGNNMIYIYNFIKHDTLLPSDFTCITRDPDISPPDISPPTFPPGHFPPDISPHMYSTYSCIFAT